MAGRLPVGPRKRHSDTSRDDPWSAGRRRGRSRERERERAGGRGARGPHTTTTSLSICPPPALALAPKERPRTALARCWMHRSSAKCPIGASNRRNGPARSALGAPRAGALFCSSLHFFGDASFLCSILSYQQPPRRPPRRRERPGAAARGAAPRRRRGGRPPRAPPPGCGRKSSLCVWRSGVVLSLSLSLAARVLVDWVLSPRTPMSGSLWERGEPERIGCV